MKSEESISLYVYLILPSSFVSLRSSLFTSSFPWGWVRCSSAASLSLSFPLFPFLLLDSSLFPLHSSLNSPLRLPRFRHWQFLHRYYFFWLPIFRKHLMAYSHYPFFILIFRQHHHFFAIFLRWALCHEEWGCKMWRQSLFHFLHLYLYSS